LLDNNFGVRTPRKVKTPDPLVVGCNDGRTALHPAGYGGHAPYDAHTEKAWAIVSLCEPEYYALYPVVGLSRFGGDPPGTGIADDISHHGC
jgi:hypothetical protein